MSKKVIEIEKLRNAEDLRCKSIALLATKKNISYRRAEEFFENDLRTRTISKLAIAADITYENAEKMRDAATAYCDKLVEIDRINEENQGLGICAEDFETYQV